MGWFGLRVSTGACSRGSGLGFGRNSLAGLDDPRDDLSDRNVGASRGFDSGEDAVSWGLDLDDGFVGFDFKQGLTLGDAVAFLLAPSKELAGFLRHLKSRHYNAEGHRSCGTESSGVPLERGFVLCARQ